MSKKMEEIISEMVVDLMLEAHEQGKTLNFSDICRMVGIPEHEIDPYSEEDTHFVINEEFIAALKDKELRKSMIERLFSTVH